MHNWQIVELGDIVEQVTVGYVGSMADEYQDSGIPFLRSLNIVPYGVSTNDMKYISPEFHSRINKSRLSPGDVVVVRTGNTGTTTVIPEWLPEANCSDLVIIRTGNNLNAHFLTYFLNSPVAQHTIDAHNVGSVQSHFNVRSAQSMKIPLPPLKEQKAIAHVLGSLDDKIEANRLMNETLEATARAIFKSWFVDFDPVHAKANGEEPYGMDAETAALFPDRFQDSELGLIPSSWEVGEIKDFGEVITGRTPSTKFPEYFDGPIPFVTPTDFDGRLVIFETARTLSEQGKESVRKAVLPKGSVMVSCIGSQLGKTAMTSQLSVSNQQINSVIVDDKFSNHYLYHSLNLRQKEFQQLAGGGSAIPILNKTQFSNILVLIPTHKLMDKFNQTATSIFDKILHNQKQSFTLAELRDTLLPRLMSGELRVDDVGDV